MKSHSNDDKVIDEMTVYERNNVLAIVFATICLIMSRDKNVSRLTHYAIHVKSMRVTMSC